MSRQKLPEEELNQLVGLLLSLSANQRDFLLDILQVRAEDFFQQLHSSLVSVDDFYDWPPRLLQQLIRDLSFQDIAWAFLGDKSDLFKLFGENISGRGRMILMEEIQAVKQQRRRKLESNKVTPEELEQLQERKRLLLKLKAQQLLVEAEDVAADN